MTFHWRPSRARSAIGRPLFDDAIMLLEDRIMLDAVPTVTVAAPAAVFLTDPANSFNVTLTFDNTGTSSGFGPYIELTVPHNGADGAAGTATPDGATFTGATFLGSPVTVAANLTFDATGHATNPLSGDIVTGTPGDGLVVLQLPFGSFTGPQTAAPIIASFTQSPLGDVGTPLTVAARGGFQFGLDALDNPATDPHLVGPSASASYTPTIAILTKTSDAPANTSEETATGPNFDHYYTINLDVANGQTLTNATFSDALPDSIVYLGATVTAGTGTITAQPTIGSVVDPAHNLLSVNFASITGGPGATDAVVKVHFYVNDTHFNGTPVVGPTNGATATTVNDASVVSTFAPLDPRDLPATTFTLNAQAIDTIVDKAIAIQKGVTIVTDTGTPGISPGDVVQYTLTFEVSDYFTLGNLTLNDVLSDGQRLIADGTHLPTLTLTNRGVASGPIALPGTTIGAAAPGTYTVGNEFAGTFTSSFDNGTGVTTSAIDLSAALVAGGISPGGTLAGGRTQAGDAAAATGGTTATITFFARVQSQFEKAGLIDNSVHQGDTVGNTITLDSTVRSNDAPATVLGVAPRDNGAASQTVAVASVGKTIYAINGNTDLSSVIVGTLPQIGANDLITYRLQSDLPLASFQALSLADFLPLPVLVTSGLTFVAGTPGQNQFAYGPTDTLHSLAGAPVPTEVSDAAGNSVSFNYGTYSAPPAGGVVPSAHIDLLFTIKASDTTFADGLELTNQVTESETNSFGVPASQSSIVQVALGQPKLLVQKAYVSASAGGVAKGAVTSPESVAGLTFLLPGVTSGGLGYTQAVPITDATLGATATTAAPNLDSNLVGLDAGDLARVAIVVNNQGSGLKGAFDTTLDDTLATGTSFLGGSLATANLIIARGDGSILVGGTDYTATQTATGLSIHFIDGATTGAIARSGAANEGDILLVTYDVQLDNGVVIDPATLTSSTTISRYAALPGTGVGVNQALVPPTDPATLAVTGPSVVKALVSTTDLSTTGANLTIGESATYRVTYTLPEGTTPLVRLQDILPAGAASGTYELLSGTIVSTGANITATFGTAVLSDGNGDGINDTATFGGAGVTVLNTSDNLTTADDTIVVDYVVRAANVASNATGASGVNDGHLIYGAANNTADGTAPIGISLPDLTVVKALTSSATPDAGDPVTFTITVANPGTVTGYAINLSDPLPAGLTGLTITSVVDSAGVTLTPADFSTAGDVLTLNSHIDLAAGQSFVVTIAASIAASATPGTTFTNTASLDFLTEGGVAPGLARTVTKTSPADVSLTANGVAKAIFTTSVNGDASATVLIGETISFDLTTTLAEGTSPSLTIADALPSGLVFVSGTVVSVGANVSGSALAAGATVASPSFVFGDVTDLTDNTPQNAADQIVVRVVARVADVPGNASGTILTDVASVSTLVGGVPVVRTSALPVTVAVPDVVVAKTYTGTPTPDAGNTVTFTLAVGHAADSTAIAYGFGLSDPLPAGLTNLSIVSVNNDPTGTGAHGLALTAADFTTAGNTLTLVTPIDLALDQRFTVTISAVVPDTTVTGTSLTNTATIGYSTLPGTDPGERTLTGSGSAGLTTAGVQTLTKVITATDDSVTTQPSAVLANVAIGETATVQLVSTFSEGTTDNVVIVDHLPTNAVPGTGGATFAFTGVPSLTLAAGVTFTGAGVGVLSDTDGDGINDTITYSLGSVTVPGTAVNGTGAVTISYQTTVPDRAENAAGDVLPSAATLTSTLGALAAGVTYDIVAPSVALTKAVATGGATDAGNTVTYTVTLSNTGSGPAYDLTLGDVAAPGIVSVGAATLTVGGVSTTFANPNAVTLAALAAGQTATVTYSAVIADSAVTGAAELNTATVTYDSHPGGGRTGTTSGTATFTTAGTQTLTKTITATDDPLTAQASPVAATVAIGELSTVDVISTFSEGTTTGVVIVDHLPVNTVPGVTGATFGFVAAPVLTLAPGVTFTGSGVGVLSDTDGDGINDTVTYSLGSVTVAGTAATGTGALTISYQTTPLDRPATQAGDVLASGATLTSTLGALAASVDYAIVAPNLVLTKAVTTVGTPDAGDTVSYTLTLSNTGSGPAHDITLGDVLAPGVGSVGAATVTVGGVATVFANPNAVTLASLDAGQTATITYTAVVASSAVTGAPELNTATVGFDSHIGGGGRAGTTSAAATFTTASAQTLTKTIIATDDPLTGQPSPVLADLNVGETATVQLATTFTQGTTTNVVIVDHLPLAAPGDGSSTTGTFAFTGTPVLTLAPGVTYTGSGVGVVSDTNGDGVPDTITYDLGSVTVAGTPGPGTGAVTITYQTIVPDLAVNAAGDVLASGATLTSTIGALAAGVTYDIVAPNLTLTKAIVTPAGSLDAGDTLEYLITIRNTGTGPAADVGITDMLPAGLVQLGPPLVSIDGGPKTFSYSLPPLAAGATAQVEVLVRVTDAAIAGAALTNIATVAYDSHPGPGGRSGTATDSATFTTLASQTLTKTIIATDDPLTSQPTSTLANLAIGETATVAVTTTFQQGTTTNVVIVDRLPTGTGAAATSATFGFVTTPVIALPAGATVTGSVVAVLSDSDGDGVNDTVTFTLGDVTIPGSVGNGTGALTISYQTTPLDRPATQAGDVLASGATLTSTLGALAASVDYAIVAPNLVLTKAVTTVGTPDAGDTVSYTLTLSNTGSGPAHDITLGDVLAPGVGSVGAATVTVGGVATVFANPNAVTLASLDAGQTATITYTAVVASSAVTGAPELNTATVGFDSHIGGGGRAGTTSAAATFTTASAQTLTKTIIATDDPLTGQPSPVLADLNVGETATVQLATTFTQGTTTNVVIVDHLPLAAPGDGSSTTGTFAFTGTPVLTLAPGVTYTGSGVGVVSDTNGDGVPDTITYDLGSVTVAGTPGPGTGAVTITYQTIVPDLAVNAAGDVLASGATLTSTIGALAAGVTYDIVAPNLVLAKAVATSFAPGSEQVNYTITVSNTGTGPASDIVVLDPLPAGLTQLGPVIYHVDGGPLRFFGIDPFPSLAPGSSIDVSVLAGLTPGAVTGAPLTNVATVQYDSHAGPGGRPGDATASATFVVPGSQLLTKTITSSNDPLTGSAAFRPDVVDLNIGEDALVRLVATLHQGTTTNVVITDRLPTNVGPAETAATFAFDSTVAILLPPGTTDTGSLTPVFSDSNGDGIDDTVTFSLGNVTIPNPSPVFAGLIGDATADIAITYATKALDRVENVAGDALASPATLTSALGLLTASVDYDLVAPTLVITKTVATGGPVDAGDTVSYVVTLTNTGSGPAESIVVADPGPGGVRLTTATVTVGGVSTPAFIGAGSVGVPALVAGATATITYAGVVTDAAVAGATQTNTATATYSSSIFGGHSESTAASAAFATAATQTFTKSIVATSVPSTGTGQFRPGVTDLVIGEQATFELVTTLSEGTTNNVVITDRLPTVAAGDVSSGGTLSFVGTPTVTIAGVVVAVPASAIVYTDTNGDGIPDTVTFNLGNVVIPGDNNPANNTVKIDYNVLANDLPVNVNGDALTSPATLSTAIGSLAAAVDVDLVQPALAIVTTASVVTAKPGDIVTYTVTVSNPAGGTAQAEDVTIADLLAGGELILIPGSVTTSQGTVTSGNGASDTTLGVAAGSLGVGATPVTITFQARVGAVASGSTVDTTASATFDGIPGSILGQPGRTETVADDAPIGIVGLAKAITATTLPETGSAQFRPALPDLAIGETATITLTVNLPVGRTSVTLTDLLGDSHGQLALVGTPVFTATPGVVFGPVTTTRPDLNGDGVPDLGFAFGTVTGPEGGTITITYQAQVSDVARNAAGAAIDLPATLDYGPGTYVASVGLDLVAPVVTLVKAVATTGVPSAGDTVSYTVTATNGGTGPAYDLTLADTLPGGVRVVPGTARITVDGVTTTVADPTSVPVLLLDAGRTAVLRFDAVVIDSAVTGAPETNTAGVTFDSLAGPGGRAGTATATATFTTVGLQSLDKIITATSETFTGTSQGRPGVPDLTIGEVATIDLRAHLSEGTTNGVVITDTLTVPGGTLTYAGTPVIVFADGSTAPFTGTVTLIDANGDGIPDAVRFTLGNVTIAGDNNPANDFVTIRYQAAVADRPENVAGDQLTPPATLTSALGATGASAGIDLVAPVLTVTKALAPVQPLDGVSTVFLLTVGHAANSSAAATGVVLADLLPSGALLSGSAVIVSGPAGATATGGTVSAPLLQLGESLVVRITTVPDFAHFVVGQLVNRAVATYGTTTGGGGHASQATASAVIPSLAAVSTILHRHDLPAAPIDERYVSPLLPIEPIYSGTAEPGSFIEITVTDESGNTTSEGGSLTDAGGNWLIRQPSTSVDMLLRDSHLNDYYASTRLFTAPSGHVFGEHDLFGQARADGRINVGSTPAFGTQTVHVNVGNSVAGFTTTYAPTWRDQVFVEAPGLSVERAFAGAAGRSLARLYDELASPEAAGLNRFNHAFLSTADL